MNTFYPFVCGSDEPLQEAHARPRRFIAIIHTMIKKEVFKY